MLSIRTNMSSVFAQRNMTQASNALQENFSKLSSGYRITKASDDAAGIGVSTNLRSQIQGYRMASRNAQDAVSVIQTTEAALNESSAIITRLRELTVQAASDGLGTTERGYLNKEVQELTKELDRIGKTTEYNGRNLLAAETELQFQIGIRGTSSDKINITLSAGTLDGLGLSSATAANTFAAKFSTASDETTDKKGASAFQGLLSTLDDALNSISERRATLGATANRLQSAQNTLAISLESAQQADSRIRDVDVAMESAKMSANQVLVQAGVSMLAQANQSPMAALKLLG